MQASFRILRTGPLNQELPSQSELLLICDATEPERVQFHCSPVAPKCVISIYCVFLPRGGRKGADKFSARTSARVFGPCLSRLVGTSEAGSQKIDRQGVCCERHKKKKILSSYLKTAQHMWPVPSCMWLHLT